MVMKPDFILLALTLFMSSTRMNALSVNVNVHVGNIESEGGNDLESDSEAVEKDCKWNVANDYPKKPPLILKSSDDQLVLPEMKSGQRIVSIKHGEDLTIACPGSTIKLLPGDIKASVKCAGGKNVKLSNQKLMSISKFGCTEYVSSEVLTSEGQLNEALSNIGFVFSTKEDHLNEDRLILIRTIFNKTAKTTNYTEHIIRGASITAKEPGFTRPKNWYRSNDFPDALNIAGVYKHSNQKILLKEMLETDKYFDEDKKFFFSKGHLAPNGDFVTHTEKNATFYYINAVPQWQSNNGGNWEKVETKIRDLAAAIKKNLTIYTGGSGVLKLNNIENEPVEIYLGQIQTGKKEVPAPEMIWKVVYEETTKKGTAIVVINNPHIDSTTAPNLLCNDIPCINVTWLGDKNEFNNYTSGYIYCCTVDALWKAIGSFPKPNVMGPLMTINDI